MTGLTVRAWRGMVACGLVLAVGAWTRPGHRRFGVLITGTGQRHHASHGGTYKTL